MGEKHSPGQAHDPTSLPHPQSITPPPTFRTRIHRKPCPARLVVATRRNMHRLIASRAHYFLPLISTVLRISSFSLFLSPSAACQGGVQDCREPEEKHCARQARPLRVRSSPQPLPPEGHCPEILASYPRDCVCWMEDELSLVRRSSRVLFFLPSRCNIGERGGMELADALEVNKTVSSKQAFPPRPMVTKTLPVMRLAARFAPIRET